jgi:site-specific recombinase XerD
VSGKYGSESECQSTEIGLKAETQTGNVTGDIYKVQNRLENVSKRIKSSQKITPRNKELIWEFSDHCRLQGLSTLRVVFYLNRFWNIARLATKNFDGMTKEDVQHVVIMLRELRKRNGERISERTIADHLIAIKTFWKWLKATENESPSEVKWIRASCRGSNFKLPEDLPSADDVQKLIDAATNARDKALISVLYDSGCRIGELLTLRVKNVEFDNYGAVLHVNGKTGPRRVRIIHSVLRLQTWLEVHPLGSNPEASLFCSLSNKNRGAQLTYEPVLRMLKKLRIRACVTRKVNPQVFRHARATLFAQHLTDAQLKQHFGWRADSRMASVYVHLSGRDLDPALAKLAGIKHEDAAIGVPKVKTCEKCGTVNSPEAPRCVQCLRPFVTTEEDERRRTAQIVFNILRQFGVEVNEKQLTML